MKYNKTLNAMFSLLGILLFLLSSGSLTVFATETQDELMAQMEESLNVSVFHEEESKGIIKCFDVNEDGYFAVGSRNNMIQIYDSFGVFQWGVHFDTDNDYGIELKGNNIVIYLGRSHIAVEVDPSGRCIGAEMVHFSLVGNVIKRTYKQIGNVGYHLERDIGIFDGAYSRLVATNEVGNRTVLYDVTTAGYIAGIFHYLLLLSILGIGVAAVVSKVKKKRNGEDEE